MGRRFSSTVLPVLVLVLLVTAVNFHVVLSLVTATETPVQHEVKAIAQDSKPVHLPCDLGISECDSPVHNIKVYKDNTRVYTYANSNDTSAIISKAENYWTQRISPVHLDLDQDPPVITLETAYLMDEGRYKCEATYIEVLENCRTVSFVNLIILDRPSKPEIEYDGDVIDDNLIVGPLVEGTRLRLTCKAPGGKPPAQITWWNGTERLGDIDDDGQPVVSTIDFELTRSDLQTTIECRAMNEALEAPRVSKIHVDVNVRPLSVRMTDVDTPVVENDLVHLSCVAHGARPKADIVWFNGSKEVTLDADMKTEVVVDQLIDPKGSNSTYTTISNYTFRATKYDNGARVFCQAQNEIMEKRDEEPLEDFVDLSVLYAPRVKLQPEGVKHVNNNDKISIKCRFDANPENFTTIVWLKDGNEIDFTDPNFSNGDIDDDEDDSSDGSDDDDDDDDDDDNDDYDNDDYTILRILRVTYLNKGLYSCKLTNSVGTGVAENLLNLDVHYPPVADIELIPDSAQEHEFETVTLECIVTSANPANISQYRWLKNGIWLNETENSMYTLINVSRQDTANYSCQAQNSMGWGFASEQEELLVQYLPGSSEISYEPIFAIKDDFVTLYCKTEDLGEPPATHYRWYREDYLQIDETDDEYFIKPVTTQVLSNYSCTAVNELGEGERAYTKINVIAAPRFIQKLPKTYGVSEDETNVSLTCHVECRPLCVVFWVKDDELLTDNDYYYIKTSNMSAILDENLMDSVVSTLFWNLTAWSDGRLVRGIDNANYSCITSDNTAGFVITSTTAFVVEYPPDEVIISSKSQDVIEGSIPEPVNCTSVGVPKIKYKWTFNGNDSNVISDSAFLPLNYAVNRSLGGTYTCTASNRHGNKSDSTYINVIYKPTCEIESETTTVGQVIVTCSVTANPSNITFEWLLDNNTYNEPDNIEIKGLISRVVFRESDEHYGTYTCIAKNVLGYSQPCSLEVTSEGGWLEKISENKTIFIIVAVVGILILLIIVLVLVFLCRRKAKSAGKDKIKLEERQTPEGVQTDISPVFRPVVPSVSVKKITSPYRLTRVKYVKGDDAAPSEGKKKKPLPTNEPDAKTFYENLPFHGMQPPPNKHARPIPAPRNHCPTIKTKPVYENLAYFPKLFTQPMFKKEKPFKPILPDLEYADVDFPSQPLNNNAPFSKAKIVEKILEEADEDKPTGKTPARPPRIKSTPRN